MQHLCIDILLLTLWLTTVTVWCGLLVWLLLLLYLVGGMNLYAGDCANVLYCVLKLVVLFGWLG